MDTGATRVALNVLAVVGLLLPTAAACLLATLFPKVYWTSRAAAVVPNPGPTVIVRAWLRQSWSTPAAVWRGPAGCVLLQTHEPGGQS